MKSVQILAAAAVLATTACGQRSEAGADASSATPTAQASFTAAEKKAAQALALTGGSPPNTNDPVGAPVTCEMAITLLLNQLENSSAVSEEQREGLSKAGKLFHQRALNAGSTAGLTSEEMEQRYAEARIAANANPAASLRTGLACLKSLAPA